MAVFVDLDNTVVDRDAAFARWAQDAMDGWGASSDDVAWLMQEDAGGYTSRVALAHRISERLGVFNNDIDALVAAMRAGLLAHLECFPGVPSQLESLVASGQSVVLVTNGESGAQRTKLKQTGLDRLLSGVVVSEEVGWKKPDARIFDAARQLAGDDATMWMIGDHPVADIAGAHALGWETGWVSHGKQWIEEWHPTLTATAPDRALAAVRQAIRAVR